MPVSLKVEKITQVVHYLLSHLEPGTTKIKVVKLAYLADKIHAMRYACTITEDEFYALPRGPIGSLLSNICSLDEDWLSAEEMAFAETLIRVGNAHERSAIGECSWDCISESNREVLDEVLHNFGDKHHGELIDMLHKFPEWVTASHNQPSTGWSRPITISSLFQFPPNVDLGVSPDHAQEAKSLALGNC